MVEPYHPYRKPKDVGSESPASGEAKEQLRTGHRGGPQEDQVPGKTKQPAQESGRRSVRHEPIPTEPKSFAPEENPALQGKGRPSPERLKARSSEQGIEPRSGSHRAHGERTEERAMQGEPDRGHARHGRQRVPGQPKRPIPPGRDPDEYT